MDVKKEFLEELGNKLVQNKIYPVAKLLLQEEHDIKLRIIDHWCNTNAKKIALLLVKLFGFSIYDPVFEQMRTKYTYSAFTYFMNRHYMKKPEKTDYLSLEKLEDIFQTDHKMLILFI